MVKVPTTVPMDKLSQRICFRISPSLVSELKNLADYLAMHWGRPVSVSWVVMKMLYIAKDQFHKDYIEGRKDLGD